MTTSTRDRLRALPVFAGELPTFDPSTAPPRPDQLFLRWLTEAVDAGVREPHAMTLSTLGPDGIPSARVLILKNVDEHGWQFAVHAASPKGRDLSRHPVAALTFYWPLRGRQVRVRGHVHPAPPELSAADFLARPPASRAEASLGRQSQPLLDPAHLDEEIHHDPHHVVRHRRRQRPAHPIDQQRNPSPGRRTRAGRRPHHRTRLALVPPPTPATSPSLSLPQTIRTAVSNGIGLRYQRRRSRRES
ncbi:pyridoxine/pyridoxamine 5'-phosphate oxidase [Actinoplanes siamensis]|uniref:Pyridoxamine 5'-phosphate oxidase N-terminal domain-containing protein n=1 Tax=Actinoplanes siamensis TaxID=1223317 RepID=A0A919N1X6_9ACTN|nr:pyridoxamine 5'-phosphate oxidase family protein [Actinoplanes siamensis]GIF02606.1 hypothetical protein Asi03nite_01440 [Actinoplanes siamensis]